MDIIIEEIIKNWGMFGIALIGFAWLLYDNYKHNKLRQKDSDGLKQDLKSHITTQIDIVDKKIHIVNNKVDNIESNLNDKIDILSTKIESIPDDAVMASRKQQADDDKEHLKQIEDVMLLGCELHKVMKEYTDIINADHMFIGSFHNGVKNLSGIPYCKFDIISECYSSNKISHDHEFAPVYKDSDILRYGSLFSTIFQSDQLLFIVDPDNDVNDLAKYEDIIWRRMYGLGIKQIAIKLLRDPDNIPSGFLGVVRYDLNDMDLKSFSLCAHKLEHIYSVNKYKKYADKE